MGILIAPYAKMLGLLGTFLLVVASLDLANAKDVPSGDQIKVRENESDEIEDYDQLDLDRLLNTVFSPAKHDQDILESPSSVSIITREQIANTYCITLACLLRQVPEMDVKQLRPFFSAVGGRALADDQGMSVLVLVDGRDINMDVFGFAWLEDLPVHLEDIERIEVVRGPGSALYGANAYSAVISISTRQTTQNGAEIFLGGGGGNLSNLHLRLDRILGDLRIGLSASHETNDSWQVRGLQEREVYRLRLRLNYDTKDAVSSLEFGLQAPDGLLPADLAQFWIRNTLQSHFLASYSSSSWQARLWFNMQQAKMIPDIILSMNGQPLGQLPGVLSIFNSSLNADLQTNIEPFLGNLLIAGFNYRWIRYQSPENNPEETNQHQAALFIQDEQRMAEKVLFTASIRFDYHNVTKFAVSPRLAAVYLFRPNQHMRIAFGQGYRKPSIFNTSFHIKGTTGIADLPAFVERSVGNDKLTNAGIIVLESGYAGEFFDHRLGVEGDIFYNQYRDSINVYTDIKKNSLGMLDLPKSVIEYRNTPRFADSVGGSVGLTYQMLHSWRVSANYTYRYSFWVSEPSDTFSFLQGEKGARIPWEPSHLCNLTGHYIAPSGLRLGMGLHFHSSFEMPRLNNGSIFDEKVIAHVPASFYVSGFVAWRFNFPTAWLESGIRVNDALDAGLYDSWSQTRVDGVRVGAEMMHRSAMLFLRGAI